MYKTTTLRSLTKGEYEYLTKVKAQLLAEEFRAGEQAVLIAKLNLTLGMILNLAYFSKKNLKLSFVSSLSLP